MSASKDSRLGLMLLYKGSDAIYKSFLASFAANIITSVVLMTLGLSPLSSAVTSNDGVSALAVLIRILVSTLLLLVGLYLFYKGLKILEQYDSRRYAIGLKSVKIGLLDVILLLASLLAAPLTASLQLLALPLLALLGMSILAIMAAIVMAFIALWRLGGEPRGDMIRKGLVLLIIGLILTPFQISVPISAIGLVLMLIGAKRVRDYALRALEASAAEETTITHMSR